MDTGRVFRLMAPGGHIYGSASPGAWGGHRRLKIYGRLDCASALRHLGRGHYARYRVFFAAEEDAQAAGYRPCGVCMPEAYRSWKLARRDLP